MGKTLKRLWFSRLDQAFEKWHSIAVEDPLFRAMSIQTVLARLRSGKLWMVFDRWRTAAQQISHMRDVVGTTIRRWLLQT
eukprot:3378231-Rhodomonas_salina.1